MSHLQSRPVWAPDKLVIVPQHCCALEMAHTAKKIKICLTERERSSSPSIC